MKTIETYQRKAFLRDHQPISVRVELTSSGTEQKLLAGSVLGKTSSATGFFKAGEGEEPIGILVEDVNIPASGNALAYMYVHADCILRNIIFESSVSSENQTATIVKLRELGIYIY